MMHGPMNVKPWIIIRYWITKNMSSM